MTKTTKTTTTRRFGSPAPDRTIRHDLYVHDEPGRVTQTTLDTILTHLRAFQAQQGRLMASVNELAAELTAIKAAVDDVKRLDQEQIAEIAALKAQIAAGSPVTQEQLDALDAQADSILAALSPA